MVVTKVDYTTFTKVDPNSHLGIIGTNHLDFDAYRDEDCYLYKDYGVDYFGDFEQKVDAKVLTTNDGQIAYFWALSNDIDDANGWKINNKVAVGLSFWKNYGSLYIAFEEYYNGSVYTEGYSCAVDTWYYLTITKSGTSLVCQIYSDSARTNLLFTLSRPLHADHKFRYLFGCNTYNDGLINIGTLDIENLSITIPQIPQITCDFPTPNFSSGCELLLHYDINKDGIIDLDELTKSYTDFESGIMTEEEFDFVSDAYINGGINVVCPGCYLEPAPAVRHVMQPIDEKTKNPIMGAEVYICEEAIPLDPSSPDIGHCTPGTFIGTPPLDITFCLACDYKLGIAYTVVVRAEGYISGNIRHAYAPGEDITFSVELCSCTGPTTHHSSGLDLLNHYDSDSDGVITKGDVIDAISDSLDNLITMYELWAVMEVGINGGSIDAMCQEIMPATASVTATSAIPLWMWDEDGIATIPCTRANPVKVGMSFGIAVSEGGENNKTTIVNLHVDTPEPKTIPFNIKLSDPLTPSHLRGTYIGNVIVNGGAGTIHVNLTSFTPERKTVAFESMPAGATVTIV